MNKLEKIKLIKKDINKNIEKLERIIVCQKKSQNLLEVIAIFKIAELFEKKAEKLKYKLRHI